jgi:acetate kinase
MNILVINSGSSSLKYQLIVPSEHKTLQTGKCEKIGAPSGIVTVRTGDEKLRYEAEVKDHGAAVEIALRHLTDPKTGVIEHGGLVDAVGHRVVHGGHYFSGAVRVDGYVKEKIAELVEMAPLHNGPALVGIEATEKMLPDAVQVMLADTAFHQSIPIENHLYAIPWEFYEEGRIRKYGFHGTSHNYVARAAAEFMGRRLDALNVISCHLGNGGSVTVIKGGRSFDTSMGFTPLDGIVMGTRCGSIDPAVVTYIMKHYGLGADEMDELMNKKSGFLGVSDVSNDFRELQGEVDRGGSRAERSRIVMKMYAQSIRRYIGSYLLEVPDVECIVCTAGIGENSAELRSHVFAGLGHMGIVIDEERNAQGLGEDGAPRLISADESRIKLLVIHTDEEYMIATATEELLTSG